MKFRIEWEEAPGVRPVSHALTWCRLEIEVAGQIVTRVLDNRANTTRQGVYGSVFPLAEWIAENWWSLLYEPVPFPGAFGLNRRNSRSEDLRRRWENRHNVFCAREGFSLPHLYLYRDGNRISARWNTVKGSAERPVEFLSQGASKVPFEIARDVLAEFVENVIDRLGGNGEEDERELRERWQAVRDSEQTENRLCALAGAAGLDPYDPNEFPDELAHIVQTRIIDTHGHALQSDIMESSPELLIEDLDWIDRILFKARSRTPSRNPKPVRPCDLPERKSTAHETGYDLARFTRKELLRMTPDEPISDFQAKMQSLLGLAPECMIIEEPPEKKIDGLYCAGNGNGPFLARRKAHETSDRFRMARALFFWLHTDFEDVRLLTKAHSWDQRVSRAFAAELLAPSSALKSSVSESVAFQDVQQLSTKFNVTSQVIIHQIENHDIGWVEPE